MQEGFASEVDQPWLARLYFMSFYIVSLVIIQVFVAYIVDEFKAKHNESIDSSKKDCLEHDVKYQVCLCTRKW